MLQFKNGSPRWEHTQMQTDARSKYVRWATQTDATDHFWASEMRRAAGDALKPFAITVVSVPLLEFSLDLS
jgi:hypothetical protein